MCSFPEISDTDLDMTPADGIPVFTVIPDSSTNYTIKRVDIYYGTDRDSRTRFWRDAGAVDMGTHWEAQLPLFDAEDMLAAHAVITYEIGYSQPVPYGNPTTVFKVASKVHTYYPTGVDDEYELPVELDTDIHQIHVLDPATLIANGLRETAEISAAIDDPSDADGYQDWFRINAESDQNWQFYTRKINDPSFRGGDGADLTFDLTADAADTLWVKVVLDDWFETDQNRYFASVPIVEGLNPISLSLSDFKRTDNTTLTEWSRAKFIGFASGKAFDQSNEAWAGMIPILANLAWDGGETLLDGEVTTTWLASHGLALSNDTLLKDSDGDGQSVGDEFHAGTDPVDATSVFKVESSALVAGDFVLNWQAVSGKTYTVEYKAKLSDSDWQTVATGVSGVQPTTELQLELGAGQASGFFRVNVE